MRRVTRRRPRYAWRPSSETQPRPEQKRKTARAGCFKRCTLRCEVVLSYWKDISHGLKPRKNLRGDPRRITKTRKICGTAVSKLHGRAPNPRARQRGGRAPVEVGDFPFLESIFMIFGKLSGLFPDNRPLRAISRRNDQRLPKSAPKILTNHRNDSKTTCRQPPRARGPPPAESGVLARPRSLGWYSNH